MDQGLSIAIRSFVANPSNEILQRTVLNKLLRSYSGYPLVNSKITFKIDLLEIFLKDYDQNYEDSQTYTSSDEFEVIEEDGVDPFKYECKCENEKSLHNVDAFIYDLLSRAENFGIIPYITDDLEIKSILDWEYLGDGVYQHKIEYNSSDYSDDNFYLKINIRGRLTLNQESIIEP